MTNIFLTGQFNSKWWRFDCFLSIALFCFRNPNSYVSSGDCYHIQNFKVEKEVINFLDLFSKDIQFICIIIKHCVVNPIFRYSYKCSLL